MRRRAKVSDLTDDGHVMTRSTAPRLGIKDPQKAMRMRVVYTGFGVGRDAFNAAILSGEGNFVRGLIVQVCFLIHCLTVFDPCRL